MARQLTDEQLAQRLEHNQVDRVLLNEAARRIRDGELRHLTLTNEAMEALRNSPLLEGDKAEIAEKIVAAVASQGIPSRQSSSRLSTIAAQVMRDPTATSRERSLAASVLSQDQTPGQCDH